VNLPEKVILFDGVCNLCNGAVQFIIKRDTHKRFSFASLQSAYATHVLKDNHLVMGMDTLVLLSNKRVFSKSRAVLEISKALPGAWPLLYVGRIIPAFLRDAIYEWVAKNRYRFFGKRDTCMIPSPELKSRFLE
jgi:predicted DCC family thiol-disulfide oxidoreductase YuxK